MTIPTWRSVVLSSSTMWLLSVAEALTNHEVEIRVGGLIKTNCNICCTNVRLDTGSSLV